MDLSYMNNVKKLDDQNGSFNGYATNLTFLYKPVSYKNFSVDIQISEDKNWGYGFNTIERGLLETTSGELLNLSIRERNDKTILGSLSVNINIPLKDFRYLDQLIISGEGYIKHITDEINPDNNLYISGILFKTSIML